MATADMKFEAQQELCCVCGGEGELMTPEEHDSMSMSVQTPLRTILLQLNNNKVVPDGRLCSSCVRRALDAYEFSSCLSSRAQPPLSEKIRELRKRLHDLTQKIDVFIVVGGPGESGGSYSSDDIIMVDRAALEAATERDNEQLQRAHNLQGSNTYQCPVCPMTFEKVLEYRAHTATHPPDSLFNCWTCGAQFANREALQEHSSSHEQDHANVCHLCNTTFSRVSELRSHSSWCTGGCPARGCPAAFAGFSRADLAQHVAAHHARPPAVLLCAVCFKECGTPAELSAHQLKHRQSKQFICGYDACILRFASRRQLLAHIRECHGGEEVKDIQLETNTTCTQCNRTFGSVPALKRHMKVHRSEIIQDEIEEQEQEQSADNDDEEYLEMETLDDGILEEIKPQIRYY